MDLIKATKCVNLMEDRDRIIIMRQKANESSMRGWSLMIDNDKIPVPNDAKPIFAEAIQRALDYYNSEIEKL